MLTCRPRALAAISAHSSVLSSQPPLTTTSSGASSLTSRTTAARSRRRLDPTMATLMPENVGRPRVEIDPAVVEGLGLIGCTKDEAAAVLKVSKDTLDRRIADTPEIA